jgi:hypothetical protein
MKDFESMSDKELLGEHFHRFTSEDIEDYGFLHDEENVADYIIDNLKDRDDDSFSSVENSEQAVKLVKEVKRRKEEKGGKQLREALQEGLRD